jgi:hypothetical protein
MASYDNVPTLSSLHVPTAAELLIITNLLAAAGPNGGLYSEQVAFKAASTTYSASSTTLQNDPDLVSPTLVANAVYGIDGVVFYSTVAAALLKIAFTVPSGASWTWACASLDAGVTAANAGIINRQALGVAALVCGCNAANFMAMQINGTLSMGASTGKLQFQAAQNVSNATAPTIIVRSSLRFKRYA